MMGPLLGQLTFFHNKFCHFTYIVQVTSSRTVSTSFFHSTLAISGVSVEAAEISPLTSLCCPVCMCLVACHPTCWLCLLLVSGLALSLSDCSQSCPICCVARRQHCALKLSNESGNETSLRQECGCSFPDHLLKGSSHFEKVGWW